MQGRRCRPRCAGSGRRADSVPASSRWSSSCTRWAYRWRRSPTCCGPRSAAGDAGPRSPRTARPATPRRPTRRCASRSVIRRSRKPGGASGPPPLAVGLGHPGDDGLHDAGSTMPPRLGADLLGVVRRRAGVVSLAAAHLADDPQRAGCSLIGAPVVGVERGVPQDEEHGREFGGQVLSEVARRVDSRRRSAIDAAATGRRRAVSPAAGPLPVFRSCGTCRSRRSRPARRTGHPPRRPGTVRIVLPELLAALQKVIQTGLVQSVEAAIRCPPVAHERPPT